MKIAITGIGIVSALGIGQAANREGLMAGRTALRAPQWLPTGHHEWPVGEVPLTNEALGEMVGMDGRTTTRNVLLGMAALREAIADAGMEDEMRRETPLLNGTTVGGMDLTERPLLGLTEVEGAIRQHEADYTSQALAQRNGLRSARTISTACSSALNAIIHAAALLLTGEATQVIAGGTEALTCFHLNGFASLGILSKQVCRPFQEDRDGINLGEGAAYLVLEEEGHALARGAKIYGYLAGYANRCDAYHQTASSPEGEGAQMAMKGALEMAGLRPQQVPYINAHGTATPNNDASEMRAIEQVMSDGNGSLPTVVESTKPLTGHTTSASGSIEAVFTLMRMAQKGYPYALSNAFGFGGNDSSIVLAAGACELPDAEVCPIRRGAVHESRGELDYKPYIPPMQARRMTPMMRQLLVVARQALEEEGREGIDGIVVGTRWGGMVPTMQLMNQMAESGERDLSPALFMNSTHNGAAGTLARMLGCKGYNSTIVSAGDTLEAAGEDASLMLRCGQAKCMLVCSIDEIDETWRERIEREEMHTITNVKAEIIWRD